MIHHTKPVNTAQVAKPQIIMEYVHVLMGHFGQDLVVSNAIILNTSTILLFDASAVQSIKSITSRPVNVSLVQLKPPYLMVVNV
jgi:hypothetical protein